MNDSLVEKFQHIETTILNGLQGDPAVYGFFPKSGDGILFDAGSLENLSHKDLLRVRHVAISHTHIDHFIGFDRLIRVNIPHFREVSVSGPPGIALNVQAKLHSYLWNLLDPGQIRYKIFEVSASGGLRQFNLSSDNGFRLEEVPKDDRQSDSTIRSATVIKTLSDGTRISAIPLDHGTTVLAYACQMPKRYQVIPGSLSQHGLSEGPWIGELQRNMNADNHLLPMTIGDKTFISKDLAEKILKSTEPRVIGYVTDIVLSRENMRRLKLLMPQVDLLICESNFSREDAPKAFAKKHLTTHHAALIAAFCRASELRVFHISNIYAGQAETVCKEAQDLFHCLKNETDSELERHFNDAL